MKCLKCGMENVNGSKLCINCGFPLEEPVNNNVNLSNNQVNNVNGFENNVGVNNSSNNFNVMNNPNVSNNNATMFNNNAVKNVIAFPFVSYCINLLLKPYETFKKNGENFNNAKTSIILAIIVTLLATIANLISTVITTVRVFSYSTNKGYTYKWDFGQLKNIQFLNLTFKNIIMFAAVIGAISLVFYLGCLVIKKNINFFKLLGISAGSLLPYIISSIVLSSIFSIIWGPLGWSIEIIGMIYTFIILYELINLEINLSFNEKIYFNLICFSILLVGGNFIYDKLIATNITNMLNSYR